MEKSKIDKETRFKGLPISPGVAYARVCLFNERRHENLAAYKVAGRGVEAEKDRFQKAVLLAGERLNSLIEEVRTKVGAAEAEIFKAQKLIVEGGELRRHVVEGIEKKDFTAETAITYALNFFESKFLEMDNEYLKERATDMGEVKRRLLDVLSNMNPELQCAGEAHCQRGKNRVVIAEELTPSLTMELEIADTLGFITERGGAGSHAAILARSLGIPAVSGIPKIHSKVFCGTAVLVDGNAGEVIVWPSEETLKKYPQIGRKPEPETIVVEPVAGFKVMANISLSKDIEEVLRSKAEGIGLYRTEFEFLSAGRLLSEDEQYERYSKVLKAMEGREVYFRLLDIGGDKTSSFLNLPEEENPYLGFRGSRFLLGRPDLFRAQARALARASQHGTVYAMYPMVIEKAQFLKLKKLFQKETADIVGQNVRHGVMFEVPSACLDARGLLKVADFASIGSNDLIQYLFAVDRDNEFVAYDYHPERRVFWSLIHKIAIAAEAAGKPLSVCGEIANDPNYILKLIKEGIKSVSVSPKLISGLRRAVLNSSKDN